MVRNSTTGVILDGKFYFMANTGIANVKDSKIADPQKPRALAYCSLAAEVITDLQSCYRIVASLDRKRLGADCWGGAGSRTEAFSIRRLGGSRWRLRRMRGAMGFEPQRGSERGLGRAAKRGGNAARIVGMVLKMSQCVCGEWSERRRRGGGHTSAPACGSTSHGRQWWTCYEESK